MKKNKITKLPVSQALPELPGMTSAEGAPALSVGSPARSLTIYLYRAPLAQFLADVASKTLVPILVSGFTRLEGRAPSSGELTSWENSLPRLASVLSDIRLKESHTFVELRMPLGGRRCDVLLSGRTVHTAPSAVVVELKAWQSVGKSAIPEDVGIGSDSRQHPSAQVRDYVQFLKHHHSAFVEDGVILQGCTYLHDMKHGPSIAMLRDSALYGTLTTEFPLFTSGQESVFVEWLHRHLGGGEGASVAETIANGVPCASDRLLDVLVAAVQGTHEWKLLDEQRRAYMMILTAVENARANGQKAVVLVRGGPGTGKSVLAIQLLAHGARKHWRVIHATGSQAFQTNLQAKTMHFTAEMMKKIYSVKAKSALPVKEMFCTFSHVAALKAPDVFDLVVADEAHRLWRHRMLPRGAGIWKQVSDDSMVEEMIRASRVTAFFLDDNQSVRAEEIGHSDVIRQECARLGVKLMEINLNLQFRCNGSESYVNWVDGVLDFRSNSDLAWRRYDAYNFHLETSMREMADRLSSLRLSGKRCRMVAGFCWPWSEPKGTTLVNDLKHKSFGDWQGAWNEKTAQDLPPLSHRYYRWANMEECRDQVGSIYAVQGFEFDHVGVIWGDDLVWRKNHWEFNRDSNKDDRFKRELNRTGEDPVTKLRNVYRVLLTRGMQGSSLFVIDDQTREKVQAMLIDQRQALTA